MIDGITIFDSLYPFEAIFKSVLLWHNKPPKVFCLTFGVQFKKGSRNSFYPCSLNALALCVRAIRNRGVEGSEGKNCPKRSANGHFFME